MAELTDGWQIAGDYVEACNCEVACQCIWLEPPDDDECTVSFAWHIDEGRYGDVDLGGANVAMLAHSEEGVMFDPDVAWHAVLLVDEAADPDQRDAIEDIYLGRAGGIFAALADTHIESVEVATAPISFTREDEETEVSVGDIISMSVVGRVGFNEDPVTISPHPLAKGMEPKVGESTTATVSYDDEFAWDVSGNNSYFSEFELTNA